MATFRFAGSCPVGIDRDGRRLAQRLVDHAITLGELDEAGFLIVVEFALDVEGEADVTKADRRLLGDAQRAAEVEIAFRSDAGFANLEAKGGRDCIKGNAGAGDKRLEK